MGIGLKSYWRHFTKSIPSDTSDGCAAQLLARVHRELGERPEENKILRALAGIDDASVNVYLRLMEMAEESSDWEELLVESQRLFAVNPLLTRAQEGLATAASQLGHYELLASAQAALLELDPPDPALAHYQFGLGPEATGKE